jgi:hypothetical protein
MNTSADKAAASTAIRIEVSGPRALIGWGPDQRRTKAG